MSASPPETETDPVGAAPGFTDVAEELAAAYEACEESILALRAAIKRFNDHPLAGELALFAQVPYVPR